MSKKARCRRDGRLKGGIEDWSRQTVEIGTSGPRSSERSNVRSRRLRQVLRPSNPYCASAAPRVVFRFPRAIRADTALMQRVPYPSASPCILRIRRSCRRSNGNLWGVIHGLDWRRLRTNRRGRSPLSCGSLIFESLSSQSGWPCKYLFSNFSKLQFSNLDSEICRRRRRHFLAPARLARRRRWLPARGRSGHRHARPAEHGPSIADRSGPTCLALSGRYAHTYSRRRRSHP